MFKDTSKQFINIKQYDKQLKISNQILKDGKIIKIDHSSFLIDENLSKDVISKLNILQQNINQTYLTTVCESINQQVVNSNDFFDNSYEIRRLNSSHNIAIPKEDLENKKIYFKDTGCDYIFSPYNILYNHIMSNGANTNSLNILILNNIVYALILDKDKRIVHSAIKTLTAFDDIQSSEFADDSLEGQKLFDEVHQLEIQEVITSITTEFYESEEEDSFCESVAIFYTVKQLNDEQIDSLKEGLMLEIEYSSIEFDEYLFNLAKQQNAPKTSFVQPREKKDKSLFSKWLIISVISVGLGAGIFLYMQNQQEIKQQQLKKEEAMKKEAAKKAEAAKIKLPNHIIENDKISKLLLSIFDIIPYNAILNELQLQRREVNFTCNFLGKDTYEKDIKPKMLKIYKTSETLLVQYKKPIYNAIVSSSEPLVQKLSTKQIQPNYKKGKFLSKNKVIKKVKAFLPKESKIKFKSKFKSKFLTYNFEVNTVLNKPKEFFEFVEQLNKELYSINISYPIEFAKTNNGLETTFNLQFHQLNKKKSIKNK